MHVASAFDWKAFLLQLFLKIVKFTLVLLTISVIRSCHFKLNFKFTAALVNLQQHGIAFSCQSLLHVCDACVLLQHLIVFATLWCETVQYRFDLLTLSSSMSSFHDVLPLTYFSAATIVIHTLIWMATMCAMFCEHIVV